MRKRLFGGVASLLLFSGSLVAQTPSKPMSPEGSAHVQVLGTWAKGQRPAFTLGRETYQNGKWIEITYGRPLQRGRDLFGSGPNYGKAANDVGGNAGDLRGPFGRELAHVLTKQSARHADADHSLRHVWQCFDHRILLPRKAGALSR